MQTVKMANQDSWKNIPCHFIWNLEENTEKDFRSVQNMLESKHENCTITGSTTHAPFLLFRAYIYCSSFYEVDNNYERALSLLDEADKFVVETEEPDERQMYLLMSNANRAWIFSHLFREDEKVRTIEALKEWKRLSQTEKFKALENATKGFALARLGPSKYEEAEKCYREALKLYPKKSRWLHDLGKLIGRQARGSPGGSKEGRKHIDSRLQEEIDLYRKAYKYDPSDESIKVWLATALYKRGEKDEADNIFKSTSEVISPVVYKKAQYLRREHPIEDAIELLEGALGKLSYPRAELYAQLAYAYEKMERESGLSEKQRHMMSQLENFEKCIQLEPSHYLAAQRRAILLGKMGRHEEADEAFKKIINNPLILQNEKQEAQKEYKKYINHRGSR